MGHIVTLGDFPAFLGWGDLRSLRGDWEPNFQVRRRIATQNATHHPNLQIPRTLHVLLFGVWCMLGGGGSYSPRSLTEGSGEGLYRSWKGAGEGWNRVCWNVQCALVHVDHLKRGLRT